MSIFTPPAETTFHPNPLRVAAFEKATALLAAMNADDWPTFEQTLALADWLLVSDGKPLRLITTMNAEGDL